MATSEVITFVASAARTSSSQTSGFRQAMHYMECLVFLNITAASGTTPTLDVSVESFDEVGGAYAPIGAFTQKTATGIDTLKLTGTLGRLIRIKWTIGGTTPSFTFSVSGAFKD